MGPLCGLDEGFAKFSGESGLDLDERGALKRLDRLINGQLAGRGEHREGTVCATGGCAFSARWLAAWTPDADPFTGCDRIGTPPSYPARDAEGRERRAY